MTYDPGTAFLLDAQATEIIILTERIQLALDYLTLPDVGYGLSAVGVQNVIDLLRGDGADWREPTP